MLLFTETILSNNEEILNYSGKNMNLKSELSAVAKIFVIQKKTVLINICHINYYHNHMKIYINVLYV